MLRKNSWSLWSSLLELCAEQGAPMIVFTVLCVVLVLGVPIAVFLVEAWLFLVPRTEVSHASQRLARFLSTICFMEVTWFGIFLCARHS